MENEEMMNENQEMEMTKGQKLLCIAKAVMLVVFGGAVGIAIDRAAKGKKTEKADLTIPAENVYPTEE